jgi:hypothetical protein
MDKKKMAADLRLEVMRLREEADSLEKAAELLDPLPRQTTFPAGSFDLPPVEVKGSDDGRRETIIELVVEVLQKRGGPLAKKELFEQVKARGRHVANIESFTSALSRAKDKVISLGGELWDLVERYPAHQVPLAAPTPAPSEALAIEPPSPETIRTYLSAHPARIGEVARELRTTPEVIRSLIKRPDSGIDQHGPGWLRVKPTATAGDGV